MAEMKVKLVSTEGTYLEATLEIEGLQYCVMDEITLDARSMPRMGEVFEFAFSNLVDEDESWDSIFQSNPERNKCIEQIEGWKYRAFGEIVSINPVKVDCGVLIEEDVIHSQDSKLSVSILVLLSADLVVMPFNQAMQPTANLCTFSDVASLHYREKNTQT